MGLELYWTPPGQAEEIIPTDRLTPLILDRGP
jgi:hypothetical protein